PLPATPEEVAAEHAALETREAQESAAQGAQWEVRIDVASTWDAATIAQVLKETLELLTRP
ncbi:MAG TPA: hypothetical protein PKL41_12075, partial [Flavobacteriales bacterium]|nr:hypothetical protein [Flavobacteriales bacterium]